MTNTLIWVEGKVEDTIEPPVSIIIIQSCSSTLDDDLYFSKLMITCGGCPLPRSRGIWLGLPDEDLSDPDFRPPDDPLDLRSAEDPWLDFLLFPDSVVPNSLLCSAAKSSICRKSCSWSPENFPGPESINRAPDRFGKNNFSSSSSEMRSSPSDTSWMESSCGANTIKHFCCTQLTAPKIWQMFWHTMSLYMAP